MIDIATTLNIISDRHADLLRDAETIVLGPRGVLFLMNDRKTSGIDATITTPVALTFPARHLPRFRIDRAMAGRRVVRFTAPGLVYTFPCYEADPDAYQYMASISPSVAHRFAAKALESLIVPQIEQC